MKRLSRLTVRYLALAFLILLSAVSAYATVVSTLVLKPVDSGYYDVYGEHDSQVDQGLAGFSWQSGRGPFRSFVTYSIPNFQGTLLSARLEGYGATVGSTGVHTLLLHEVTNAASAVSLPSFSATNIYADLGDGPVLGSHEFLLGFRSATVDLSNGLAAITAARGQSFVLGGEHTHENAIGGEDYVQFPYATWAPVLLTLEVSVPPEPFIYAQPTPSLLFSNDSVISVGVSGAQPLTYTWYVDGTNFTSVVDQSSIYLSWIGGTNLPVFVVVSNSFGSVTSSVTTILRSPGRMEWPATNIALRTGQTAFIPLQVYSVFGFPYPGLRWFKDGVQFSNPSGNSLYIFGAEPADSGDYFVVASNAAGVATSAVMRLTVTDVAPRFWQHPQSSTNPLGSSIGMNVATVAGPPAFVYWYHNNVLIPPNTNDSGQLILNALTMADSGDYFAVASNHVGMTTSRVAHVEVVLDPPVFLLQPQSQTRYAGSSLILESTVGGAPYPSFRWYFNDQLIPGAHFDDLVIPSIEPSSAGNYYCVASNASGVVTSDVAVVTVLSVPPVLSGPDDASVLAGSSHTFSILVSNPPACLEWYFEGLHLSGFTSCTGPFNPNSIGLATHMPPSNTIVRAFAVLSNAFGFTTSRVATITVSTVTPVIHSVPTNLVALEGTTVYVPVFASGAPAPRLYLFREGQIVSSAMHGYPPLPNITPEDAGEYTIVASNIAGIVTSPPFRIEVQRLGPLDRWTRRHPSPQGNDLHALTFGQGLWAACGDVGTIITSTNGTNWSVFSAAVPAELEGIAYGNGMFVAVGEYGVGAPVVVSTNGETWTTVEVPTVARFRDIAFGQGRFLALGWDSVAGTWDGYVSTNAEDWVAVGAPFGGSAFNAVAFNNGTWVIAVDNGTANFSSDLVTWTNVSTLATDPEGAAFVNDRFMLIGNNGRIATSPNGQNWTFITNGVTERRLYGAAYSAGVYVAVGARGTIITSPSATDFSWTQEASPTPDRFEAVVYAKDLFVAVGEDGTIVTSYDGHVWTDQTRGVAEDLEDIAVSGDLAIVVGKAGTVLTSTDGRLWSLASTPSSGTAPDWHGVGVGDGKIVVVGESTNILVSTDQGASWQQHSYTASATYLKSVIYAQGRWVAVGVGGVIMTSSGATNWTQQASPVPYDLNDVAYGNGQYVVVGDEFPSPDSTILVSGNGTDWNNVSYGTGKNARAVTFANGRFLIGANDGRFLVSSNPLVSSWTAMLAPRTYNGANLRAVNEHSNIWIAVGNDGIIATAYTATNGTIGSWKERVSRTVENLHGVHYFKGSFLAVGNRGVILQSGPLESRMDIERMAGGVRLLFTSPYEGTFTLQESTDLSWQDAGSINNQFGTVEKAMPASGTMKLYRVVAE